VRIAGASADEVPAFQKEKMFKQRMWRLFCDVVNDKQGFQLC
jgi:hypothetical protein